MPNDREYCLLYHTSADVPWIVAMAVHTAATPVILSFFETEQEAVAEIARLKEIPDA